MKPSGIQLFVAVVALATGLVACTKPCKHMGVLKGNPGWTAHPGFIAPGGYMCGMDESHATLDYKTSENPWVRIVDYLEGRGWKRVRQNLENPKQPSVSLRKGRDLLTVWVDDNGRWSRVMYNYSVATQ